ncbi:MAG: hypothetical protein HYZ28_15070 [Myxococcales bacterium]|nr:hypothetical protein [Myxococcales bacterium]
MNLEELVPPSAAPILRRLHELKDVRLGLPVSSHRRPPVGPVVIFFKRAFRHAFQPFINEMMRKQALFNEDLLGWAGALYGELRSLDSAALGMRASLDLRLKKLEEAVARIERQLSTTSQAARPAASNGSAQERN